MANAIAHQRNILEIQKPVKVLKQSLNFSKILIGSRDQVSLTGPSGQITIACKWYGWILVSMSRQMLIHFLIFCLDI
jgi:hypothetical protein